MAIPKLTQTPPSRAIQFVRQQISKNLAPYVSVRQSIPIIALQLLEDISSSKIDSLKARTLTQITTINTLLCECGCRGNLTDTQKSVGAKYFDTLTPLIMKEWRQAQAQLHPRLAPKEAPKIDRILSLLNILLSELKVALDAKQMAVSQKSPQPATTLTERQEKIREARKLCPWQRMLNPDAPAQIDSSPNQTILELLKNFIFSLNILLHDEMQKKLIQDWAKVESFLRDLKSNLQDLEKLVQRESQSQNLLVPLKRLIDRLAEKVHQSPVYSLEVDETAEPAFQMHAASPYFTTAITYGWYQILEVLEDTFDRLQRAHPVLPTDFSVSPSFIAQVNELLRDLKDWIDVMQEEPQLQETETQIVGLPQTRKLASHELSAVAAAFNKLCLTAEAWQTAGNRATRDSYEAFQNILQDFIPHLEAILSMLEAPLIRYANASDYLDSDEVRKRRAMISQSTGYELSKRFEATDEISESDRKDLCDWLEMFAIPLRGIILALRTLPVVIEEPEQISPAPRIQQAPEATRQKKHKKKKPRPTPSITEPSAPPITISEQAAAPSPVLRLPDEPKDAAPIPTDLSTPPEVILQPAKIAPSVSPREGRKTPDFARVKRKERHAPSADSCRKIIRLLERYGFEQESGGKHLKFVNAAGRKITVPYHGGKGSIAKGTKAAIISRAKELADQLRGVIQKSEIEKKSS